MVTASAACAVVSDKPIAMPVASANTFFMRYSEISKTRRVRFDTMDAKKWSRARRARQVFFIFGSTQIAHAVVAQRPVRLPSALSAFATSLANTFKRAAGGARSMFAHAYHRAKTCRYRIFR